MLDAANDFEANSINLKSYAINIHEGPVHSYVDTYDTSANLKSLHTSEFHTKNLLNEGSVDETYVRTLDGVKFFRYVNFYRLWHSRGMS